MNTPNPLIPQGTFPDTRGRSHIRIAVFSILAVHVVLLGALLMAGCKKTAESTGAEATNAYTTAFVAPTNQPPDTNLAATPVAGTPPSPANSITAPTEAEKEHVVMKNDSFSSLAKKYGVTTKAIADVNPGVDSSKLKIGQKLKIPAASAPSATTAAHANGSGNGGEKAYMVKSGDNLLKIAKVYGVSVKAIRTANDLKTDQIKVGQKLKIPAKAAADSASGPVASNATATNPTP